MLTFDQSVRTYLEGFDLFRLEGEATHYIDHSLGRIQNTLKLIHKYLPNNSKILELGAHPYYLTLLLKKFTNHQVWITDYQEEKDSFRENEISLTNKSTNEAITLTSYSLNLEKEPLPFDSNFFDVVLCCEILEHLILDPAYMFYQIHRVLKKEKGILILTTPNVICFDNVRKLIMGQSIYHPYSGYGIYGRHNKEYSPSEVKEFLEACNFKILELKTGSYKAQSIMKKSSIFARLFKNIINVWHVIVDFLSDTLFKHRKEAIFLAAQAYGDSRPAYPERLYAHMNIFLRFIYYFDNNIQNEETVRCTKGWYHLEKWNTGYHRWTKKAATVFLKNNGKRTLVIVAYFGGSRGDKFSGSLFVNNQLLRNFEVYGNWWRQLDGRLKGQYNEQELEIRIVLNNTWNPGGNDVRDIGMAVRSIQLIE